MPPTAIDWLHSASVWKNTKQVYVYPLVKDARSVLVHGANKPLNKLAKPSAVSPEALTATDPFVRLWKDIIGTLVSVAEDFDFQWQQ